MALVLRINISKGGYTRGGQCKKFGWSNLLTEGMLVFKTLILFSEATQ